MPVSFMQAKENLVPEDQEWSASAPPTIPRTDPKAICAKLTTVAADGRRETLLLSIEKPITIGRHPNCTYVIQDSVVSAMQCKIYAVPSGHGGILVSCQDRSSNGLILNGDRVRKTSILLMNGDILQIPKSQKFQCIHLQQPIEQKNNVFDPTPPQRASLKKKHLAGFVVTSHCLGSGTFGTVHLAIDTSARKQIACKSIKRLGNSKLDAMLKEVEILTSLNHPNINRVLATCHDESFLHIFLELCTGGDLFSYITRQPTSSLCEAETKFIMYQLLKGLQYLHNRQISHRDLKPENILLRDPGAYPRIQIADFGLARPQAYQDTFTVCGTVSYLPPEGIFALDHKDRTHGGMPADCWSAGVVMYIMLAGFHPFDYGGRCADSDWDSDCVSNSEWSQCSEETEVPIERVVKKRITRNMLNFTDDVWHNLRDALALCRDLLRYEPRERATVRTALYSAWFTHDSDLDLAYRQRIIEAAQET